MPKIIEHIGNVVNVEKNKVYVSIYSNSPCFACDVKTTCSISGTSEKILEFKVKQDEKYSVGQHVKIRMKESAGLKSVVLAYLLPFVIMITSIAIFNSVFHNDGLTGLMALVALIIYFIVLYNFRDKIEKTLVINIEP